MLTYTQFDASPCGFPASKVTLLPVISSVSFGALREGKFALVGARSAHREYRRGRYALLDAYRYSGVDSSGSLLAPAYHCRTMIDPAIRLGGALHFYEMDERLAPRLSSLQRLVACAQPRVRAMLLTHYFGFAQDVDLIQAFCTEHGIALIEDCSHALFNLRGRERLGQAGRYTITSPYKLLPCEEGGLLIGGASSTLPEITRQSSDLRTEVRILVNALQRWATHKRSQITGSDQVQLSSQLDSIRRDRPIPAAIESRSSQAGTSSLYLRSEEGQAGPRVARWLTRICDIDTIALRRRENYQSWSEWVHDIPHCRALFSILPDDCVPYMFPLLLDYPESHFYLLKKLGLPIWRWDEMAVSDCGVAGHFRQHLLHLPCHQALTHHELKWMQSLVKSVVQLAPTVRA